MIILRRKKAAKPLQETGAQSKDSTKERNQGPNITLRGIQKPKAEKANEKSVMAKNADSS